MLETNLLYSIAAIAVTIASIYYIIESQHRNREAQEANRLKKAELLWTIYKRWGDPEFLAAWNEILSLEWTDYEDYMNKYGPNADPEFEVRRGMVGIYFESLGVMLKRGLVDVTAIDDMMSGYIIGYWKKYEPIMMEFRRRHNRPEAAEHIEYLYKEVQRVYKEQHPEN